MTVYRIRITMTDGAKFRYTGLFAGGIDAVLQALQDFPQARSVSAICTRRSKP